MNENNSFSQVVYIGPYVSLEFLIHHNRLDVNREHISVYDVSETSVLVISSVIYQYGTHLKTLRHQFCIMILQNWALSNTCNKWLSNNTFPIPKY